MYPKKPPTTIHPKNAASPVVKSAPSRQKFKVKEKATLFRNTEMDKTKLTDIFDNAPTFLSILKGRNFVFEYANKAYFNLVGKKKIIGKTVAEAFPEVKAQGYLELLDNVFTSGQPFISKEMKLKLKQRAKKSFTEMYVDFVYLPMKNKKGEVDGIVVHGFDITEQVKARKEAERMWEKFETMANNIPNLAWIAKADGQVYWYNNRWYEYTGTTLKEMETLGWKSIHDPEKLTGILAHWELSIKKGQPFEMVFPLKNSDQIFHPFLTKVIPIRNKNGEITRWLGTSTDITNQKDLERMKDDFIAVASHELRTPVTIIKLCAQVLEQLFKNNGDTAATNWLATMNGQISRLIALIEDMLDATRFQTGTMQLDKASFDMNELVMQIVSKIQEASPNHCIEVDLQKTTNLCCDRESLGRVISNLLTNAIKYSPNANKVIVRTKVNKSAIVLSVKDFGFGIKKDKQEKVFEQFYRVNENQQYTFPGLGLGLYISSEIIKSLKGKIWVESEEGKGSVFHFKIPTAIKKQV